jgi:hypothetical protein
MALNPLAAMALASGLVDEPITGNVLGGLLAVIAGIGLATTGPRGGLTPCG